ncbi:uncharacterized protein LOC111259095 isoform X2 [Varroa jacobsoni]|uniref:uncharacterized protein LOC111259095 isoform X2 n=1 Tax=Varroa jacobsoni TaxID=62625 RepID=UPI000BF7DFD4|nr:uncharacterized protein LOC111259095 isoform X2 [Varroa jacobsoni]
MNAPILFEPFIFQNRSTTHVTIAGPLVITLEAIMAALKLRNATIVSSRLEPYGVDTGNGTHSGILGRVQSGEAHLILNVAICDENRFTFVDPVILLISAYRLLTAKARKVIHPFNFLRAFQPDVWYILFPSINVAACCIFLLDRYIVKGRFGTSPATLSAYIWNFWRRFFPQEPLKRNENWLRVAFLAFMLAMPMQLMVVFSGELTSSMAIREEEDHIVKLEDVLRFKKVRIYAEIRSALSLMFKNAQSPLLRKVNRQHIPITGSFAVPSSFYPRLEEVERQERVIVGDDYMFVNMIEKFQKHRRGVCPRLIITKANFGTLVGFLFISRTLPDSVRRLITLGRCPLLFD